MMDMPQWKRIEGADAQMRSCSRDGVTYLTFPLLDAAEGFGHAVSTRMGGVSTGWFSTLNMAPGGKDDPELVRENHRRFAAAVGYDPEREVCSAQTHTVNVRRVGPEDLGCGYIRPRPYTDVDGLITDMPGVALLTFYADCVPLILIDPVRRAVGCAHSGWRGTVADMGGSVLRAMHEAFGTDPADVLAGIGPCICQDCYEVSGDVIGQVDAAFPEEIRSSLYYRKENGKYQLDLREACRQNFLRAGVPAENIAVSDLCTACNKDLLFSHRATAGKRGNIAAVVFIREEEQ